MKIRLWKLGSLEHKIIPTKESINEFRKLLKDNLTDEVVDIVWGPEVECEVIDTENSSCTKLKAGRIQGFSPIFGEGSKAEENDVKSE